MKKQILIVAMVLLGGFAAAAQGTDALPFVRVDRNPVTAGMAGAGSASTLNAAYSAFSNAAVLPFYDGSLDAGFSFQAWAPGSSSTTHLNLGVAYKFSDKFALSVGAAHQRAAAYDLLDYDGLGAGYFTPVDNLLALGLAFGFTDKLSLGVNARFAMNKITAETGYNGFSGDVFLGYQPIESLRIMAGVASLGTPITAYNKKKYNQPASVKVAADYSLHFAEVFSAEAALDFDYYFSKNYAAALGAQFGWNEMAFVRLGYRLASPNAVIPSHLAIGLGGQFKGFRLDLAFLTASKALANTLTVGLGYRF